MLTTMTAPVPPVRVAFLGAGGIATTHARAALACGATVVAACGRTTDSAGRFVAKAAPGAGAYDDLDRMLDAHAPDALYVCLPPDAHAGQAERAAARGVALFLEKPLALTVERAASIAAAVGRAGVVSHVGYQMRFAGPVWRLKQMLADGSAGRPVLFQAAYLCNALHAPWWRDAARSGGQAFEQAIHLYDLATHLFGPPTSVTAWADNLTHGDVEGYTSEDASASVVRFAGGGAASIAATNCATPTQWRTPFRVVCRNVTAEFESATEATFTHTAGRPSEHYWRTKTTPTSERVTGGGEDVYVAQTRAFLDAVRGDADARATLAPASEGLLGVRLVSAVLASARAGGTPVAIPS